MRIRNGVVERILGVLLITAALSALSGVAQGVGPGTVTIADDAPACRPPAEITDTSGAVARNLTDLTAPEFCIMRYGFDEGDLNWQFLVVRNTSRPASMFWVVLHDDEGAAFDSAVYGVRQYGGTVVAVKTGGERFNYNGRGGQHLNPGQDPNRNFDLGSGSLCPKQLARSPIYTAQVLRWRIGQAPIIGLHTNDPGFDGGNGGSGNISIRLSSDRLRPFPAQHAIGASPDDTMVYVASRQAPGRDTEVTRLAHRLNANRVNVAYEIVSRRSNDCSLSNYTVLAGGGRYFNIEAVHGDTKWQREIIRILMGEIGINAR